jgi:GxxExxY protein
MMRQVDCMSVLHLPTESLTGAIIGSAVEVHRQLGPGLLESAYQKCLAREFWLRGLEFEEQVTLPLQYKGLNVEDAFRIDFRVSGLVLVEVKSIELLRPVHTAQVITYLNLTDAEVGLLLNFNVPSLRLGIRRVLNTLRDPPRLRASL